MARKTRDEILSALTAAVAAGEIRNVDYKDLSDDANRALYRARSELLSTQPRWDDFPYEQRETERKFDVPYSILHLGGFLKRVEAVALKKAPETMNWPWFAARVALAREWLPIAETLIAARPLIVKGRKPKAPDPNAPQRSDAICQCCGRQIEANRGDIAHHGYERPGHGWQTGSCLGALFPPFQISRDRLGWMIETVIKPDLARWKQTRIDLDSGTKRVEGPVVRREKTDPLYRANDRQTHTHQPFIGPDHAEYPKWLGFAKLHADQTIRFITRDLGEQQARFDAWKPSTVKAAA